MDRECPETWYLLFIITNQLRIFRGKTGLLLFLQMCKTCSLGFKRLITFTCLQTVALGLSGKRNGYYFLITGSIHFFSVQVSQSAAFYNLNPILHMKKSGKYS